ncbi:hypothetical protein GWI33_011185, partial [Rhynchophorus ferrugineus]
MFSPPLFLHRLFFRSLIDGPRFGRLVGWNPACALLCASGPQFSTEVMTSQWWTLTAFKVAKEIRGGSLMELNERKFGRFLSDPALRIKLGTDTSGAAHGAEPIASRHGLYYASRRIAITFLPLGPSQSRLIIIKLTFSRTRINTSTKLDGPWHFFAPNYSFRFYNGTRGKM